MFYKDEPQPEKLGSDKYWCPNGRRPNLVVLCKLPHTETGDLSTSYTYDKTEVITTENWCLDRCLWLKAHPEYRPKK